MFPTVDYMVKATNLGMIPPVGFLDRFRRLINDTGTLKSVRDVIEFNRLCESHSYESTIYILSSVIAKESRKEVLIKYTDSGTPAHLTAWLNSILLIESKREEFHYDELIGVIISALDNIPFHRPAFRHSRLSPIIKDIKKCRKIVKKSDRSSFSKLKKKIKSNLLQNNSDLYERMIKDPILRQKYSRYERALKIDYESNRKMRLEQARKLSPPIPMKQDTRKLYNLDCGTKYDFNMTKIYPTLDEENKKALISSEIDIPPVVCDYPDKEYELEDSFIDFLPTSPTNIEVAFEASRVFNMRKGHPEPVMDNFVGTLVSINGSSEKSIKFARVIKENIKNDFASMRKDPIPFLYTEDINAICPERRARTIPSKTVKYCGVNGNKDIVAAAQTIKDYDPLAQRDFVPTSIMKKNPSNQSQMRVKFLAGPLFVVTYHSFVSSTQENNSGGDRGRLLTRPVLGIKNLNRIGSVEDPPRVRYEGIEYPRFPTFFVPFQVPRAIQALEATNTIQYMQYGTIGITFRTKTYSFKR